MFVLTETLEAREVRLNNKSGSKAKCIAYGMVIHMVHDNTQLGREIRKIHKWDGKRLIIRYGNEFVTMEQR